VNSQARAAGIERTTLTRPGEAPSRRERPRACIHDPQQSIIRSWRGRAGGTRPAVEHLLALIATLLALAVHAADGPYDEAANAQADIQAALAQAATSGQAVLVVFGANWCGDCKVLDQALRQGPSAALVAREFKLVKVNVGRFDRNVEIALGYGVPLKKGIPAVAILSAAHQVLYVTRAGELADARNMGERGIHDFLAKAVARPAPKS
jgi:protein disulfide-isomerase